ncbi:hypothetical protein BKA64DRAFT_671710 [Cadophora sp. MPI-SDFR-AT-0126]|nr:hypothetical protein BKA64DRAFT_671710 [Leotiomycetes sp. MPI-SDFR-AT-0126]
MDSESQKTLPGPMRGYSPFKPPTTQYQQPFGKHKGKTLREIEASDPRYMYWLHTSDMAQTSRELQIALAQHEAANTSSRPSESSPKPCPLAAQAQTSNKPTEWTPPDPYSPPLSFRNMCRFEDLWISCSDAKEYFKLTDEHAAMLPIEEDRLTDHEGYWLYRVWDLSQWLGSGEEADRAVKAFVESDEEKGEDVWGSKALGMGYYNEDDYL